MEENLVEKITAAEEQAAELKTKAQAEAEKLIAEAERKAAEILKKSEADCNLLRENTLAQAAEKAEADYRSVIGKTKKEAKAYADGLISRAEIQVGEIVGRLTK